MAMVSDECCTVVWSVPRKAFLDQSNPPLPWQPEGGGRAGHKGPERLPTASFSEGEGVCLCHTDDSGGGDAAFLFDDGS